VGVGIREAITGAEYALGRVLFEEYAAAIEVDLCFQNFSAELESLPVMYGPPSGVLLIARDADITAGCIGVRRFEDDVCEMKRLYVRPPFRGQDLGRRLALEACTRARQLGYRTMILDTLRSMAAAHALYRSIGFRPAAPYYQNPLPDVSYFELDLGRIS
jgi:putative acetyltransferase